MNMGRLFDQDPVYGNAFHPPFSAFCRVIDTIKGIFSFPVTISKYLRPIIKSNCYVQKNLPPIVLGSHSSHHLSPSFCSHSAGTGQK